MQNKNVNKNSDSNFEQFWKLKKNSNSYLSNVLEQFDPAIEEFTRSSRLRAMQTSSSARVPLRAAAQSPRYPDLFRPLTNDRVVDVVVVLKFGM